MPEIRHFVVTETRRVQVSANNAVDAAKIGQRAFDGEPTRSSIDVEADLGIWGHTNSSVQQTELNVKDVR
jgi:hypothetical protein